MERIMRMLSEDVGPRFGGTAGEHRAAELLLDAFASDGFPARLQKYRFIGWKVMQDPSVMIVAPERHRCSAAPVIYSASTPLGGVTGRVVYHGRKILIRGLYEMRTYAVVDERGDYLAELIVEDNGAAIPLLNPRPIFRLPLVVIGAEDDAYIRRQIDRDEEVVAHVGIETELDGDSIAYNVIAEYRGDPASSSYVVVNAHYDSQLNSPGCYDNASGVAGLFGLARRLRDEVVPINVDFVAVASEEIGMHGSSYHVMDLVERDRLRDVRACICFDQISAGDTLWIWAGPDEMRRKALESVRAAGLDRLGELRVDNPMPGCDMWPFYVEGVPSVLYMWWRLEDYHKPTDRYDKVEMNKVEACVDAAFQLLTRL